LKQQTDTLHGDGTVGLPELISSGLIEALEKWHLLRAGITLPELISSGLIEARQAEAPPRSVSPYRS